MIKWKRCWWERWRLQRRSSPKWVICFNGWSLLFALFKKGVTNKLRHSLYHAETSSSQCLCHCGNDKGSTGSAKGGGHDRVPHGAASSRPNQDGIRGQGRPFRNTGETAEMEADGHIKLAEAFNLTAIGIFIFHLWYDHWRCCFKKVSYF